MSKPTIDKFQLVDYCDRKEREARREVSQARIVEKATAAKGEDRSAVTARISATNARATVYADIAAKVRYGRFG